MGFGGGFKGGKGTVADDFNVSGSIIITEEQSGDPSNPGVGGVVYVKSGDPTKLWYKGKDGAAVDLTDTGGGGGTSHAWDGATSNGVITYNSSTTASVEANLTFDAGILTVTGQVTASVGLSGAAGQFTTLKVGGSSIDSAAYKTDTYFAVASSFTNVDNTTDVLKPVSTATSAALDLKAALTGATFSGAVIGTQLTASIGMSASLGQFGTVEIDGDTILRGGFATPSHAKTAVVNGKVVLSSSFCRLDADDHDDVLHTITWDYGSGEVTPQDGQRVVIMTSDSVDLHIYRHSHLSATGSNGHQDVPGEDISGANITVKAGALQYLPHAGTCTSSEFIYSSNLGKWVQLSWVNPGC